MSGEYKSREQRRKAQQSQKKKKKAKKSNVWKKIFIAIMVMGILGMIGGGVTVAYYVSDAPTFNEDQLKGNLSSKVFDMNGEQFYEIGTEKATYVPIDEIPDHIKNAFIATEDIRFYEHSGIDVIRFGGAVLANLQEGFGAEGASTITQQLVKLSFLTPEKTIKRKVQEAWLAIQIEQNYSKDQILEMYLNRIYYPGNYYGVARASEAFFGKEDLNDVTIGEAAMLAGMIKNPSRYNPRTNPEDAENRRNVVLMLMEQHGFISSQEAEEAKQIPITDSIVELKEKSNQYYAFIEEVIDEVREELDIDPSTSGLKIYTTLDQDAQSYVENLLNGDSLSFSEHMQAGVALLDTQTGEIRALGGGRNQPIGGFNYATDAKRQPGSTIKPVLDYGPAIEHLKWSTYEQINDEPYSYSDGSPINNWDNSYRGWMSMRDALAFSRNIPALKAMQEAGLDRAKAFAEGIGIELQEIYESYSIGGFGGKTVGVSPLEMAGAYSAFGNNGFYIEPHTVTKVELADGTVIELSPEPEEAMSDYTAFMITDMLKSVVQYGTGTRAKVSGLNIAGKTGTTNFTTNEKATYNVPKGGAKDSWFVGYTPKYTAAVWTGMETNDEKMYLDNIDQRLAKDIFKDIIVHVSKGDSSDFKQPKSVVKVAIEKGSNPAKLASEWTPSDQITYEYFVKGAQPTKVSDKYQKLEKPGDVKIAYNEETNDVTLSWNYSEEFMESTSFEVQMSVDEGPYEPVTTTKDFSFVVTGVKPGSVYKFQVFAVSDENSDNRSDPGAAMIEIPKLEEEEEDEENEPDEEDLEELLPPGLDENNEDKKDKKPKDSNSSNGSGNNENEQPVVEDGQPMDDL